MPKVKKKYEVANINETKITIDVSLLASGELFFNSTEIAKQFGKQVKDFLKTATTKEYIGEIFKEEQAPLKNYDELVVIKKGRYGGTWLNGKLSVEFLRWCKSGRTSKRDSYVYLLECDGFHKIGVSCNVIDRVLKMQTGNPHPIKIITTGRCKEAYTMEAVLHKRFFKYRASGEWFDFPGKKVSLLISLINSGNQYP